MSLSAGARKIEHNGAKNGGGAWCKRAVAKSASRRRRRIESAALARKAKAGLCA